MKSARISRTRLFLWVIGLVLGIGLTFLGFKSIGSPPDLNLDEKSVTVIDLTLGDSNNINLILILGIVLLLFVGSMMLHSFLMGSKPEPLEKLTDQEKKIVSLIQQGKTNKEIAIQLAISISTVKTHINNIYKKLSVNSRDELLNIC